MSTTSTPHKSTVQVISPHLFDEKLKDEKKYWLHHLSGKPVVTGLPLDYVRPAKASLVRALCLNFDGALHERLVKLCGGRQPLMFAVLVAAVKIVLHKYTGAEDIIVGTTVHNLHADVSTLNRALAIRDHVNSSHTVKQFLMQVERDPWPVLMPIRNTPFSESWELLEIERHAESPASIQHFRYIERHERGGTQKRTENRCEHCFSRLGRKKQAASLNTVKACLQRPPSRCSEITFRKYYARFCIILMHKSRT